jgi:hypothetical protein
VAALQVDEDAKGDRREPPASSWLVDNIRQEKDNLPERPLPAAAWRSRNPRADRASRKTGR